MVGHGAASSCARRCGRSRAGAVEIVWPGWGLLPQLVSEAGATPVPVAAPSGTRTAMVCRPNDPTGEVPAVSPGDGWLILDEALAGLRGGRLDVINEHRG